MASRPMQLGVSTWVWTSPATTQVLETLLPHIASLGFDVIELPIEEVGQFDVARVDELARAHGLAVSICAVIGPGRDLLLPDEAERGVAYLRSCIEVAQALGSPAVAGPFYSAVGRCWRAGPDERERDLDQVARTLRSLGGYAADHGVVLGVETLNRFETSFLNRTAQALDLIARERAESAFPLVEGRYWRRLGDPPPVWISEAVVDLHGFGPGSRIDLPLDGKTHAFVVAGVFRDYARQHGAILMDRARYIELTGDQRVSDASLWLARGATVAQAMEAIRALPGGAQLDIGEPGEIRATSLEIFDRSFAVTYAMEAVAVLVGLFGLSSSLGAMVLGRRRELGMLRHLGLTRRQVGAMLAAEGGLLAILGAAAGLAAGGAISLVLVYVVNRQSFNWSIGLHVPWALLGVITAVLFVLAVLTALLSAREAMGMGPVRAVREDW